MLAASTRLGPYEIIAPLGAGGMGEVYRARDTRLDREVAIKVLPAKFTRDPDRRSRFEREAKAVAALSHPNILAIHDYAAGEDISFAVMELLQGETLRRRLKTGAFPWRRAVEIAAALADGLAAAHAKGIVHRDLKPDNIFLTSDGRAKILDFGLARVGDLAPPQNITATYHSDRTDIGTIVGTVGYMSPEQVRGQPADARSDIFALGCVLYEMVTGRRAFDHDTGADTMSAILRDEPPELSGSGKSIPFELARIIRHCLEKDVGQRFESARDLAFDLRAVLSDSDVAAATPQRPVPGRRTRVILAAVAVSLGLLAAVLVPHLLPPRAAESDKAIDSIAVLPLANVGGEPDTEFLSDGLTESLINNLAQVPNLRVLARSTVFRYKGQEVDPQKVGRELQVRAVLTGRVAQRDDAVTISVELVDVETGARLWGEPYQRKFADIVLIQEEIAKQISEKLRLRLTGAEQKRLARRPTENAEAFRLYLLGRYYWNKRNREGLRQAIDYLRQAVAADANYSLAYAGLADAYMLLAAYNYLPPTESVPPARIAVNKALELDPELGEAYTSRAWIKYIFDRDWTGAETDFRRALQLNPGYATGHHWYADYLTALGRFDEAGAEIRRAQELDPFSSIINRDIAWPYYFARRYDDAIAQSRKVLATDPGLMPALTLLGRAYEQKGMYDEAVATLQKAVTDSGGNTASKAMLAHVYASKGQADEARRMLAELVGGMRQTYVSPYSIATIYAALGETDQAFVWLRRATDEHSSDLAYVKVDPKLDRLRPDPRFADLLKKMNLPP
jgi:serine/threonine protein kinase/tetratricopeptide (TPR) repeat protein